MYKVTLQPAALNDIEQAALWYAEQVVGLDIKIYDSVFLAIEKLQSDVFVHGAVFYGLSRVFVKKFPFMVFFKKNFKKREIVIYGVIHEKQNKAMLKKRL